MQKVFTNKKQKLIFSLGIFFAFIILSTPQISKADVLSLGEISSCGELVESGTYTLTQNVTAVGTSSCFTISADNVTIVSGTTTGYTITGTGETAIDTRARDAGPDSTLTDGANAYTNLTIQNITISGFTNSVNASGNNNTNGVGGNGGNITISASTLTDIISNGGNGSITSGGDAGNVNITDDSSVGDVSAEAGFATFGEFVAQNADYLSWMSITSTPSGDVYAVDYDGADGSGGDIYKQTAGTGAFVAQNAGDKSWSSIASTPSGDVYAVVDGGDIHKQTSGTGAFVAQNAGTRAWISITSITSPTLLDCPLTHPATCST